MNSENKEQTPKKTAQFVCDYRDEQPTEFLPQLQMHSAEETKEEPSSEPIDNTIPTIHVTLDDSNMIETEKDFLFGKEIISPPDYFILQIPKLRSNRKRKYMRMRQNNQNQKESSRVL